MGPPPAGATYGRGVSPTLDPHALERLGEDLGDDDLLLELAQDLIAALPARLAALRAAATAVPVDADAEEEGRRAAHTLKSTARLMGLVDLGEHAAHLEASAPVWSPDALVLLDRLAAEARAALGAWVARTTTEVGPTPG